MFVIEYALLFVFPAAMIFAAMSDLTSMQIPNRISIVLAATFLVLALIAGLPMKDFAMHLAAGAVVLAVGIMLFAGGIVGGGDAKLIAAASLWVGFAQLLPFITYVALFGGALALLILAYRRFVPEGALAGPEWALRLKNHGGGIPYGIAISAGALTTFPATQLYRLIAG